jgi:two-component system chemotaxis response regulator CheY
MDTVTSNIPTGVLIVDDEIFFRELLKDMLAEEGIKVVAEAVNGLEAIEKFGSLRPSLVLMDIYMPDKNGIDATMEIIAIAPDAKILVFSGTGFDNDVDAALKAGARGVIFKPFYKEEVISCINNVMAGP